MAQEPVALGAIQTEQNDGPRPKELTMEINLKRFSNPVPESLLPLPPIAHAFSVSCHFLSPCRMHGKPVLTLHLLR